MKRIGVLAALALTVAAFPACAKDKLIEPHMHIVPDGSGEKRVALTLDACSGGVDMRIISALIDNEIPATLFITRKWLRRNSEAAGLLKAHADLFEFEDHGAEHVPPVIGSEKPYGLKPAGTPQAVLDEVLGGAKAVDEAFGGHSHWYRGATALYTPDAIRLIEKAGYRIGGFSVNGDLGASASEKRTDADIERAKDGDVIISHMNQPKRVSGPGVVKGVLALKKRGFQFVRLDQVELVSDEPH